MARGVRAAPGLTPLRILIVSDTTGHMRGGVPAATRHLLTGLAARGHAIGFCSDVALVADPSIAFFPAQIFEPRQLAAQLVEAIGRFRPDVVHLISMSSRALAAATPGLGGHPWVLTCHSIPPYERKVPYFHGSEPLHYALRWLRFLANTLAWRYLFVRGRIPHVIVHSEWVGRITRRYGYPAHRTSVVPLGFEAGAPPAADGTATVPPTSPTVVTVGGIAHTKGQHDAVAAVARLRHKYPGIQYRMVGEIRDAAYLRWLTALIHRLGVADNVRVLDALGERDKQRLLDTADVYLQPSHEEGFCLAFLEAAFCVPRLVATDAGAMRGVCGDDPAARVVPVRDPAAMASAIDAVLSGELPARLLDDRTKRLGRDFSWQAYTDAHERLYRRLHAGAPA